MFGRPPFKGSWLGVANEDIAWNYKPFHGDKAEVKLEFVFPETVASDGCASMILLRESNEILSGKVKTFDPMGRNQVDIPPKQRIIRRDDPANQGMERDLITTAVARAYLGLSLADLMAKYPGCTDRTTKGVEPAPGQAVPGTVDLVPAIDGNYLAYKRPSRDEPDGTLPALNPALVEAHSLSCVDERYRTNSVDLILYKGHVMIVDQGHVRLNTMPIAIRLAEISAVNSGKPGPVFESHYNDSPVLLTTVQDENILGLISVIDGGRANLSDPWLPTRPDSVDYVDMDLWKSYTIDAKERLAVAMKKGLENPDLMICMPEKCPLQWHSVQAQ